MDRGVIPSDTSIPFSFFVSLLSEISKIRPQSEPVRSLSKPYPALRTFQRWIAELHRRFGPNVSGETASIIFRLLFPEHDIGRKYDMQESRLAQNVTKALGVSDDRQGRGAVLNNWKRQDSVGCIGKEVLQVMGASATDESHVGSLNIHHVDSFLNELASFSPFSHESVHVKARTCLTSCSRTSILRTIFGAVSPLEASFLTQIILKDLRPVLYPVTETHYTSALKQYKSNSIVMLTVHDALVAWDTSRQLLKIWNLTANLEEVFNGLNDTPARIFTPLQIPKTIKGTSCANALRLFRGARRVWAETKYDGERAQIHVKIDQSTGTASIRIFSKSRRDSTSDRIGIHSIIRDALGLSNRDDQTSRKGMRRIERDIIVEAEMVAFSELVGRIDEFWRIRSLIETTAVGPRRITRRNSAIPSGSPCSLASDASDEGNRHLALVFFDVLLLDSIYLASTPYSSRRKLLESVVLPIPGYSILAERSPIDLSAGTDAGRFELRTILARVLGDHQEGLVLKADDGHYVKSPWVKLKKDYIPSLGDCLDCVIVGAGWDKERGRELRVPPSTYTTFYLGLLVNEKDVKEKNDCRPSFEVFFFVSYGLSRDQLEGLNFMIKSSETLSYDQFLKNQSKLDYDCNFLSRMPNPDILLERDSLILAEILGAGFTKAPQSHYYELRFPRMTKVFRRSERSWIDGSSLKEFQSVARQVVGRERPGKEVDDWCKRIWGKPISPSVKHPLRKRQREEELLAGLEMADKKQKRTVKVDEGTSATPQRFITPSPLRSVTNLTPTPSNDQKYPNSNNRGSSSTQNPLQRVQATPTPLSPLSPPVSTPTPRRSYKSRFPIIDPFLLNDSSKMRDKKYENNDVIEQVQKADSVLPTPCPTLFPIQPTSLKNGKSTTFIDLVEKKRKRDVEDVGGSAKRRRSLKYHVIGPMPLASAAREVGSSAVSVSHPVVRKNDSSLPLSPLPSAPSAREVSKATTARTLPNFPNLTGNSSLCLPPPPPPGATGWHPRRKKVGPGENYSDKMVLYGGSNMFYTNLPPLECEIAVPSQNQPTPLKRDPHGSMPPPDSNIDPTIGKGLISGAQALVFTQTAVGKLLASSIVWFAQDLEDACRSAWDQLVPQWNRVTRLDALLVGCGWHMLMNKKSKSSKVIERGVAFVDFEENGEEKGRVEMAGVIKKCEEAWEKVSKWKSADEMKPVWVMNARVLRWDILREMGDRDRLEELERFVLWRKD